MARRRLVKCTACGNMYRHDHKGCPTCNGKMKEKPKTVKRKPNNR